MAGVERVSLQSLWSLMGLLTRSAQRLGVHRDGELIGLGPTDTEERRRIWWQIQHIDLLLTLRLGLSPFTLTATWDAKLPLNIEDADLQSNPSTAPAERKGLTSFSWCLYTYWLLDQQRSFFRMQMSQGTSSNILNLRPDAFVERLEDGINTKFLQYCDPTRPIDCMLQLSARSLICIFRLRNLHAARPQQDPARHAEYFAACLQLLRYNVALHAQPSLRRFHFWTQQWFPWHACPLPPSSSLSRAPANPPQSCTSCSSCRRRRSPTRRPTPGPSSPSSTPSTRASPTSTPTARARRPPSP